MPKIIRILGFLLRLCRDIPYSRLTIFAVVVAGVISGVLNTGLIVLVNAALTGSGPPLTTVGLGFAGLCIGMPLFRFLSQVLLLSLSQRALADLRLGLARRILSSPQRHLEDLGAPRLLATLTNDIGSITQALTSVPMLSMHLAIVVACLGYLGRLSWSLLLVVLASMMIGITLYQMPFIRGLSLQSLAREQWDVLFKHLRAITDGGKELKMHQRRRKTFLATELEPAVNSLRQFSYKSGSIFALAASWGQVAFFVVIGLLLFVMPRWIDISSEIVIGYTITLIRMMTPLEIILNTLPNMSSASVAVDKIENLGLSLSAHSSEPDAEEPESRGPHWGSLGLVGVTHSYRREGEERPFTLGPLDLEFRPGELVFVIGGNGSGKTTLAKILIGLYSPESGELRFGGEPITNANRDLYRQSFSVVFSDYFLFESFIGMEHPDLDSLSRRYLKRLQLERHVAVDDGRLSTLDLSQGQRKRLALLTALLEDRPIYLFDEWAADQDPLFKEIFYLELLHELRNRGKTVFVITHDDRYFHVADRIIKLAEGRVEYDQRTSGTLERNAVPSSLEQIKALAN